MVFHSETSNTAFQTFSSLLPFTSCHRIDFWRLLKHTHCIFGKEHDVFFVRYSLLKALFDYLIISYGQFLWANKLWLIWIPDADTECAIHGSICNVKSPWEIFPFELALCLIWFRMDNLVISRINIDRILSILSEYVLYSFQGK